MAVILIADFCAVVPAVNGNEIHSPQVPQEELAKRPQTWQPPIGLEHDRDVSNINRLCSASFMPASDDFAINLPRTRLPRFQIAWLKRWTSSTRKLWDMQGASQKASGLARG